MSLNLSHKQKVLSFTIFCIKLNSLCVGKNVGGTACTRLVEYNIFDSESQPEYFLLSNFVWYSNWPSRYHKLPSRCATATFTISSKTASQLDSHFHTMTWRDLHNSEEGIISFPILGKYRRPKKRPAILLHICVDFGI